MRLAFTPTHKLFFSAGALSGQMDLCSRPLYLDGTQRRSSMKAVLSLAVAALFVSACDESTENPTAAADIEVGVAAKASKVDVCHSTGSESNPYNVINISGNALDAHLNHGDEIAGGSVLDENCEPVSGCPCFSLEELRAIDWFDLADNPGCDPCCANLRAFSPTRLVVLVNTPGNPEGPWKCFDTIEGTAVEKQISEDDAQACKDLIRQVAAEQGLTVRSCGL